MKFREIILNLKNPIQGILNVFRTATIADFLIFERLVIYRALTPTFVAKKDVAWLAALELVAASKDHFTFSIWIVLAYQAKLRRVSRDPFGRCRSEAMQGRQCTGCAGCGITAAISLPGPQA